jgi:hypothetical protein
MILRLPYPDKLLWPNGRTRSPHAKARKVKSHKTMAWGLALQQRASFTPGDSVGLHIVVHAKRTGPLPDKDNVVAAVKSYQDGIAQALGIDDKHFATPTVEFAPTRTGEFVIHVGGADQ